MCFYCKNDTLKASKTSHVVSFDNCIIIVKNVPCEECEQCGEKYFSDETVQKLDLIIEETKQVLSEITVVDYEQKTA